MKVSRYAPGGYDIETVIGTFHLHSVKPDKNYGYGRAVQWYLTWPGRIHADAVFPTKRLAIAAVLEELK